MIARIGLVTIVNEEPDMTVVAEATNGAQAVALYREFRPDIVLMDIRMPVMDGVQAVNVIRAEFHGARVLTLTTYGGDEDIHRACMAGVDAYLKKDVQHDELIQAIRAVHAGQKYFPSPIMASLAQTPRPELSARELDVLRLVVKGLSNERIAYTLNIADNTVANHLKSIFGKLGVDDRTQATTAAIQRGKIIRSAGLDLD